jgi:hypothetical protein
VSAPASGEPGQYADAAERLVALFLDHPGALAVIFFGVLICLCALPGGVFTKLIELMSVRASQTAAIEHDREEARDMLSERTRRRLPAPIEPEEETPQG